MAVFKGILKLIGFLLGISIFVIGFAQMYHIEYPRITEEQFNAIQLGMSPDDVAQIVGTKGKLVYESEEAGYSQTIKQVQTIVDGQQFNGQLETLESLLPPKKLEDYKFAGVFKPELRYIMARPIVRLDFINDKLVKKRADMPF
jgi:hypothetical protein